jgi:5'-3' exonuclease
MTLLILIDTSYTAFYRFFATIKWFSFVFPEEYKLIKSEINYDWFNNSIFMSKYEKMFMESIIKLITKKVIKKSQIIFCLDSPKDSLWRNELYCHYKSNRYELTLKYNFKNVFNYTYNNIIPNIMKTFDNCKNIKINDIEADDIIAGICMFFKSYNPNQYIYIISGDEDFLQLGRENITFINYKNKKKISLTEDEAKLSLKKKILFGDNSDCIKSIIIKNTKIKKNDLLNDNILNEYLQKYPEAKEKYKLNQLIIDFNNIPKNYITRINKFINDNII